MIGLVQRIKQIVTETRFGWSKESDTYDLVVQVGFEFGWPNKNHKFLAKAGVRGRLKPSLRKSQIMAEAPLDLHGLSSPRLGAANVPFMRARMCMHMHVHTYARIVVFMQTALGPGRRTLDACLLVESQVPGMQHQQREFPCRHDLANGAANLKAQVGSTATARTTAPIAGQGSSACCSLAFTSASDFTCTRWKSS